MAAIRLRMIAVLVTLFVATPLAAAPPRGGPT